MVHYDAGDFSIDSERIYSEFYIADDQSWDEASLQQLQNEYNIFFMTSGDGVIPVKLCSNGKSIVLGSEDDGVISFQKWSNGQYVNCFSTFWISSLIADLRAVENHLNQEIFF